MCQGLCVGHWVKHIPIFFSTFTQCVTHIPPLPRTEPKANPTSLGVLHVCICVIVLGREESGLQVGGRVVELDGVPARGHWLRSG